MNCYGSTLQQLPPLGRAVLTTIDRARGLYRTRGIKAREVAADLNRTLGRAILTAQQIGLAFAWLQRAGFITRGERGWRRACR